MIEPSLLADVLRGFAFQPEAFNQFGRRGYVFDDIDAQPCMQRGFLNASLKFSTGRGEVVTENWATVGSPRQNVALTGPLACWRTSGRIPHHESSIPQRAVWGIWPTVLKARGQDCLVRVRLDERPLVGRMGITFDRRDEPGAQHCARCTGYKRFPNTFSIADSTTSQDRRVPSLLQDIRQGFVQASICLHMASSFRALTGQIIRPQV
jgi:hypothetical protein